MRTSTRVLALAGALCLILLPAATAVAAPKSDKGGRPEHAGGKHDKGAKSHEGGGAGGSCAASGETYDTGGAPGTGAVNDPLFDEQWGLDQVNAPEAWARGITGEGAVVAIVDSGVDLGHPDLQANLLGGRDVVDDDNCAQDENGHGTHVAGISSAVTDNGIGVAGTAPDAQILPVRVLDEEGEGTFEDVAEGIRWAADHGADVINLSLGVEIPLVGEEAFPETTDAIDHAWSKGAVVVAAAGNSSLPLCSYPSDVQNVLCVGATDRREAPSYYSNFPNDDDALGVRAPGGSGTMDLLFCEADEEIWSTIWPGSSDDCAGDGAIAGYDTLAGTSMAAPFVSGVAALLAAQGLTNQQILERITATARDPLGTRGTYDPVYGYGIVDADAATAGAPQPAVATPTAVMGREAPLGRRAAAGI